MKRNPFTPAGVPGEGPEQHLRNALAMLYTFPLDPNTPTAEREEQNAILVAISRRIKTALGQIERVNTALLGGKRHGNVRRRNPLLGVLGNPRIEDATLATWAKIEYVRPDDPDGDDIVRVHEFSDGFEIGWLSDGSVQLSHPKHPLWVEQQD